MPSKITIQGCLCLNRIFLSMNVGSKIILWVATSLAIYALIDDEEEDDAKDEEHEYQLPSLLGQSESGPFRVLVTLKQVSCCSISSHLIYNVRKDPRHSFAPVPPPSPSKAKLARDDLDQALIEATNDDNWQASTAILHEIASSAYSQYHPTHAARSGSASVSLSRTSSGETPAGKSS
jgi:hypothetical protein